MCSAVKISGSSPSKRTSTTAPMTWVIVPMLFLAMSPNFPCGPSQQLGQNLLLGRLELIDRSRSRRDCLFARRRLKRYQLVRSDDLGHRRAKAVVDDRRDVKPACLIEN